MGLIGHWTNFIQNGCVQMDDLPASDSSYDCNFSESSTVSFICMYMHPFESMHIRFDKYYH